jgi:RNA-directed DNA polymerase
VDIDLKTFFDEVDHCLTVTKKAISIYLKSKLKLTINEEKSGIRKPVQFVISFAATFGGLGCGFVPTYKKGDKGKYQLVVGEKA